MQEPSPNVHSDLSMGGGEGMDRTGWDGTSCLRCHIYSTLAVGDSN